MFTNEATLVSDKDGIHQEF